MENVKIPRFPNDRDYFFGENEDIYQVLGYSHTSDSIYCLKKYEKIAEDKKSKDEFYWYSQINNSYYRRVITSYSSESATENINNNHYKKFSELYGVEFILYPRDKIRRYFDPTERLNELFRDFNSQKFEIVSKLTEQDKIAIEVAAILEMKFKIPIEDIGVTGSMSWQGIHKYSDIDIVIYGINNTLNFIRNSIRLLAESKQIRKLTTMEMITVGTKFSRKTGLSIEDCVVYTARKPYLFYYGKYYLSIAFCPRRNEIQDNLLASDNTKFVNEGEFTNITFKAIVSNVEWGYFYPAVVYIKDVQYKDKKSLFKSKNKKNIIRILIFERESSGYFGPGSNIEVRGALQKIVNPPMKLILSYATKDIETISETGDFYQIVIGTKENYGNEYIKNLDV